MRSTSRPCSNRLLVLSPRRAQPQIAKGRPINDRAAYTAITARRLLGEDDPEGFVARALAALAGDSGIQAAKLAHAADSRPVRLRADEDERDGGLATIIPLRANRPA